MIKREKYIHEIRSFYDSDLIKIITGVRRSGKSVLLQQLMEEIKEKTSNVIYLNFEDLAISGIINTPEKLIEYIEDHRNKEGRCYVFLDEIQTVENWASACKTLRLHNNSLFITGSNSKLLSGEFTKELSGRYVSFTVRPFVFKELKEYGDQLGNEVSITDYLIWGGFPKRIEFPLVQSQKAYLNDLVNTIVINDLCNRYSIRKKDLFIHFVRYILITNSRIFSARSIHKYINDHYGTCSINTILKYIQYLEEAYVIESVGQYSTKAKKELSFYKKLYNVDVSLNSIMVIDNRFDISHNLENVVYNELRYMGYDVKVYDSSGKEIDFIASKDGKRYLVQVAYTIAEEKAYQREFGAFKNIDNSIKKIIITNDEFDYSTSAVQHISLSRFLFMSDLEG